MREFGPQDLRIRDDDMAQAAATRATTLAPDREAGEPDWSAMAREAHDTSISFLQTGYYGQWQKNIRLFRGQHPMGSKYLSDQTLGRSRLFRPKTRATIRRGEASVAAAFFSNKDVTDVEPAGEQTVENAAGAAIMEQLLQYRLTKTIPWFLTIVAAYQTASVMGLVTSRQYWCYKAIDVPAKRTVPNVIRRVDGSPMLDETGKPLPNPVEPTIVESYTERKVLKDKPCIDLQPPEWVLFHPNANWMDIANDSPYLIVKTPMFLSDINDRMGKTGLVSDGDAWTRLEDAEIRKYHADLSSDEMALVRDQNAAQEKSQSLKFEDVIWVHENFMRHQGLDFCFFTLGPDKVISKPRPVQEAYPHLRFGERPVVIGLGIVEAFRPIPSARVELAADLQVATNEVANQRIDNVHLAMNGRWIVRAGGRVDIAAVLRNIAGGVVTAQNPREDVRVERPQDVTQSAYAEQDRINVDMDDILGSFSTSSVQTNRALNETVGGMNLLSGHANAIGELDLRVLAETWVEPVLSQLVRMEQKYEDDLVILSLAASKANVFKKFGVSTITDDILRADLLVNVNVGIGATDPTQQMQKLGAAVEMSVKLLGDAAPMKLNVDEIIKEIFGKAGYKDGQRFVLSSEEGGDPRIQQLMMVIQKLQKALEEREAEFKHEKLLEIIRGEMGLKKEQEDTRGNIAVEKIKQQGKMKQIILQGVLGEQQAAQDGARADRSQQRQLDHDDRKQTRDIFSKATAQGRDHAASARGQNRDIAASERGQVRDLSAKSALERFKAERLPKGNGKG